MRNPRVVFPLENFAFQGWDPFKNCQNSIKSLAIKEFFRQVLSTFVEFSSRLQKLTFGFILVSLRLSSANKIVKGEDTKYISELPPPLFWSVL